MNKIAIVFSHYGLYDVARQSLESFRNSNPGVDIILSSFDQKAVAASLRNVFQQCRANPGKAWRNADLLFFNSFLTRNRSYSKWFLAEWAAYCSVSIVDFFAETWKFDAVAAAIATPARDPEWYWFKDITCLPLKLRQFACGIKPITACLFSQKSLDRMVQLYLDDPFDAFCELRLGTLACAVDALASS